MKTHLEICREEGAPGVPFIEKKLSYSSYRKSFMKIPEKAVRCRRADGTKKESSHGVTSMVLRV